MDWKYDSEDAWHYNLLQQEILTLEIGKSIAEIDVLRRQQTDARLNPRGCRSESVAVD